MWAHLKPKFLDLRTEPVRLLHVAFDHRTIRADTLRHKILANQPSPEVLIFVI